MKISNKFNSNTLTKEDLELREAPISKGNKDTCNDLLKDHGIDKVTTKTETITKDEAIKDFGSDKVKDAENKADQELNDKNKSEQERADQIESDYNKKIKETIDEIINKSGRKKFDLLIVSGDISKTFLESKSCDNIFKIICYQKINKK